MNDFPHVIFLSGPIGVGKSTLGRSLANALSARFVDGDDFAIGDRPWFTRSLKTQRAILQEVLQHASGGKRVVVAYPLRCVEWIFHKRHLAKANLIPVFVTLSASYDCIVDKRRGRTFSDEERCRIREMIEQGYCDRAFSDHAISSGQQSIEANVVELVDALERLSIKYASCNRLERL